jgi:hypothetical protein
VEPAVEWSGEEEDEIALSHGHCFPAVVICRAIRCYFRFSLSLRDIEV